MYKKGQSGNPSGRPPGHHSPERQAKKLKDEALLLVCRGVESGSMDAAVALLNYESRGNA